MDAAELASGDEDAGGVASSASEDTTPEAAMTGKLPWDVTDADLAGYSVFDLPSPSEGSTSDAGSEPVSDESVSGSDEESVDEDQGVAPAAAVPPLKKRGLSAAEAESEEGAEDEELEGSDLDEDALMRAVFGGGSGGESSDDGSDGDSGALGSDGAADDGVPQSVPDVKEPPAASNRKKKEKGGAAGGLFAAYEDYEAVIADVERARGGAPIFLHMRCGLRLLLSEVQLSDATLVRERESAPLEHWSACYSVGRG